MMKHTYVLLCLLLMAMPLMAQTDSVQKKEKKERRVELYGSVYDSFTKAPVKAHITLMNAADSTVVDTTTCWTWTTGDSEGLLVHLNIDDLYTSFDSATAPPHRNR